eukprot:365690-Chlamydomonas_euryale.AAC.10
MPLKEVSGKSLSVAPGGGGALSLSGVRPCAGCNLRTTLCRIQPTPLIGQANCKALAGSLQTYVRPERGRRKSWYACNDQH